MTERQFWLYAAKQAWRGVCTSAYNCENNCLIHWRQARAICSQMNPLVARRKKRIYSFTSYAFDNADERRAYCLRQAQLSTTKTRRATWRTLGKGE